MLAIIMAGGRGTRISAIAQDIPCLLYTSIVKTPTSGPDEVISLASAEMCIRDRGCA